jgi:hypothetical protein
VVDIIRGTKVYSRLVSAHFWWSLWFNFLTCDAWFRVNNGRGCISYTSETTHQMPVDNPTTTGENVLKTGRFRVFLDSGASRRASTKPKLMECLLQCLKLKGSGSLVVVPD